MFSTIQVVDTHLFTLLFFSLVAMVTMSMLFRMIGSLSKTYEQTLASVTMIIFNFLIYAGLVVPPSYMVSWLAWIRWISPVGYTYESLMINEVASPSSLIMLETNTSCSSATDNFHAA